MALLKDVSTPSMAVTTYHRIVRFEASCDSGNLNIMVAGYVSKEARDAGAQPLWHEYVNVPFSVFEQDPRSVMYQAIKDLQAPVFADAASDTEASPNWEMRIKPAPVAP